MGIPYEPIRITSSVYAMATEPIAYSLLALDKLRNRADGQVEKHRTLLLNVIWNLHVIWSLVYWLIRRWFLTN